MITKHISSTLVIIVSLSIFSCKDGGFLSGKKQSALNGGTFYLAENNQPASFFPLSLTSQVEGLIASQVHESLIRLNPKTLEITSGIVEKWEVSADGKLITFNLRKDVFFQDDKLIYVVIFVTNVLKFFFNKMCDK